MGIALLVAATFFVIKNLGAFPRVAGIFSERLAFRRCRGGEFRTGRAHVHRHWQLRTHVNRASAAGHESIAAFPIMMGSDGLVQPVASLGFFRSGRFSTPLRSVWRSAGSSASGGVLHRQAPSTDRHALDHHCRGHLCRRLDAALGLCAASHGPGNLGSFRGHATRLRSARLPSHPHRHQVAAAAPTLRSRLARGVLGVLRRALRDFAGLRYWRDAEHRRDDDLSIRLMTMDPIIPTAVVVFMSLSSRSQSTMCI